jgi:hypothetical protein
MDDRLYRIKTFASFEKPEIKGKVTMILEGGMVFADVQPVKIKATKRKETQETDAEECNRDCANCWKTKVVDQLYIKENVCDSV